MPTAPWLLDQVERAKAQMSRLPKWEQDALRAIVDGGQPMPEDKAMTAEERVAQLAQHYENLFGPLLRRLNRESSLTAEGRMAHEAAEAIRALVKGRIADQNAEQAAAAKARADERKAAIETCQKFIADAKVRPDVLDSEFIMGQSTAAEQIAGIIRAHAKPEPAETWPGQDGVES